MPSILGALDIRKHGDTRFKLLSPVEFQLDNGKIVIAERGFIYDSGSIPPPFRTIVCPFGTRADLAWLCHDRIYYGHRDKDEHNFTRLEADSAMLELLIYLEVPDYIAYGAYTAVRAGALESWMNPQEHEEWERKEDHEYLDQ